MKKAPSKNIKVLSLFTGIGGLDLGFEKAGFDVVATLEWDKDCCDTLRANKEKFFDKNTKIIEADITKIEPSEIYNGKIDFFIGGPPCQTFSAIGRRAGGASGRLDDRGNLFKHYCRLIRHYQPKGFMFENVRGILSSNRGQDWQDILKEFSALGYQLKYRVLDTAGYGVAQHRERVILVGQKSKNSFLFPRPTHGPDSRNNKSFTSASEALRNVEHTEDEKSLFNKNGKYDDLLGEIPPGTNYLFLTEEMGHPNPKFAWRSKFSDFLYKAHPDTPVKTIVASMGRYSGPFHWDGRKLSIGELLRLQGFPDGYILAGGRTSKIKQIGNSVVPQFSYPLALAVKQTIFGDKKTNVELLPDSTLLSIDKRKGVKARGTRSRRISTNQNQQSIFDVQNSSPIAPVVRLESARFFFGYPTKEKIKLEKSKTSDAEFCLDMKLQNGTIEINLNNLQSNGTKKNEGAEIEMSLNSQTLGEIKKLRLNSDWYETGRPFVLWDAVNIAIATISPFPSIHELYGHFTEPNPKFNILNFKVTNKREPISRLLLWMSDVRNTMGTQSLNVLENMGFDVENERELLKSLRDMRIDLRTNLTNKRIGKGEFRVCYPYTLPIDKRTFVTINK